MVVSDITNPHYFELIRGAEMRARVSEYTLLLVNAEESPRVEWEQIQRLSPAVDGFLLAASRLPDENLQQIAAQRPVVLMSRELPGLASVVLDHVEGCRQIVAHLASLGHRDLLYLAGPRNSWMAATRWAALQSAAEQFGIGVRRIGPFTPKVTQGGAAADGALNAGATAVVAHNDLLAIGVMQRLSQRGRSGARGRQRRRLRRHLRRGCLHARADHPGRRPRRRRTRGRRAAAHRRLARGRRPAARGAADRAGAARSTGNAPRTRPRRSRGSQRSAS